MINTPAHWKSGRFEPAFAAAAETWSAFRKGPEPVRCASTFVLNLIIPPQIHSMEACLSVWSFPDPPSAALSVELRSLRIRCATSTVFASPLLCATLRLHGSIPLNKCVAHGILETWFREVHWPSPLALRHCKSTPSLVAHASAPVDNGRGAHCLTCGPV